MEVKLLAHLERSLSLDATIYWTVMRGEYCSRRRAHAGACGSTSRGCLVDWRGVLV
jgi:hypothetical protein